MVGENLPADFADERDDPAAIDSVVPAADSVLDTLAMYSPAEPEVDEPEAFTVTNPPGSVSVSASPDGRISQVELSPKAGELTEADLAAEIVVLAGLAARDAKSAQYSIMLESLREQGHDDAATRDFLTRDLDLPSPEQARAERARVFATRYAGDHD